MLFIQLAEGKYDVQITLMKPLDYERRNSYLINLLAVDGANDASKRLQARATVAVDVLDVQVSGSVTVNPPRSIPVNEIAGDQSCERFALLPSDCVWRRSQCWRCNFHRNGTPCAFSL